MEDQSRTTMENLKYSQKLMEARGGGKKVALVSNNYHIYRCLTYAKSLHMRCVGVGAGVALYFWPTALIREFVAVFRQKKFMFWSLVGYALFLLVTSVLLYYM